MALPDPVVEVRLTSFALEDLRRLNPEIRKRAVKKILLIERSPDVGEPLGRGLTGFRKIVLGNRDWRIIFRYSTGFNVAEVWAVVTRTDEECYIEAEQRLSSVGDVPEFVALREVVTALMSKRERPPV